jgi:hypothetical protein
VAAVIVVELTTVAGTCPFSGPKLTDGASASEKPVPVIVTSVPPLAGPVAGLTDVTVGAAAIETERKERASVMKRVVPRIVVILMEPARWP